MAQKQPFTAEAMWQLTRISEPALSPDGKTVAFVAGTADLDKGTRQRHIYTVPLAGGTPKQLTREGSVNERPRWTSDSRQIAFGSNRGGSSQVWLMNADGSGPKQITTLATEASGLVLTPDGKSVLVVSEVYPGCTSEDCNKKRLAEDKEAKSKARVYTSLLYRHWTEWQGARRKHLLLAPLEGGEARDLTPGPRDVPSFSLGGPDDYAVSPDGKEIAYVMNPDANPAVSTNNEIYTVAVGGGEPRRISISEGSDVSPSYSPDGKYIAWRSQTRAGFEADRWKLTLIERSTGRTSTLTDTLDRNVESFTWSPDSSRIFFVIEDRGRTALQMLPVAGGAARSILSGPGHVDDVQFTPDGKTMIYSEHTGSRPIELFRVSAGGGSPVALTGLNDAHLSRHHLTALEEIWVEGADRTRVHAFVVKPPDFDERKKHPVLVLIHGGPQGAWGESWSYRWNAQVMANAGFLVVMPNPRGSTGYGQRFTDEISGDWAGKVYTDLMAVVDHVAELPYADKDRMAAAGGSYGGYMVNWLLGHTDRFKAFVSHAGVYDLPSMGGETEELWFTKWEFRGMPWENPEMYEKWSPSRSAKEFKTPTLVFHGELDYRVPYGQGLQLFTALQMQKVPSKLVLYPDEGHWILKPHNSLLWYKNFLDWVTEWTRKPAGN